MIANIALSLWPVVAIILYRKFSLPVALIATMLGGYLLLPQWGLVDLPVLPALNRVTIPLFSALALTIVALRKDPQGFPMPGGWIPRNPFILAFIGMLLIGPFLSAQANRDTLVYGDRVLPGLSVYDSFSLFLSVLVMLIPFLLARRVFASYEAQRVLLLAIIIAALCYMPLILFEVRMSPQLHSKFYGGFQHSFAQHMRGDGFRPIVFLNHGLALSMFLVSSVIASVAVFRFAPEGERIKWLLAAVALFITLVLSKSLGPLLIAIVLLPVALFCSLRTQLIVAACVAGMVMTYPVLRAAHVVPIDQAMTLAKSISEDRAKSFEIRLANEEALLEKALERPLFGWGGFGRNRIFDNKGRNLSLTDGTWIIEMGDGGWLRYIGFFGLLCWPIIGLLFVRREKLDPVCVALALILCAKLVDLIPNSGVRIYWLLAGALAGRLELLQSAHDLAKWAQNPDEAKTEPSRGRGPGLAAARTQKSKYARSFPEKEARRAEWKATRKERPVLPYNRPAPNGGYRK